MNNFKPLDDAKALQDAEMRGKWLLFLGVVLVKQLRPSAWREDKQGDQRDDE